MSVVGKAAGFALVGLLVSRPAGAEDPWGRPMHLRAVAEPPAKWTDIGADRTRVRLWWDEVCPWKDTTTLDLGACRIAEVQVLGRRWRTVATGVRPGWTSGRVRPGSRFRVRVAGAARWSEVVSAPDVVTPSDLAALSGRGLLADEVGQVAVLGRDAVVASTLGGGLVRAGPDGLTDRWTRWDGLPDDRVLAVDARGRGVLVGTGRGAALLQEGRVVALFDDLPSTYVQATHIGDRALWLGTDAGLARVVAGTTSVVSTEASVFSVSPARGGGVWVGAGGLWRLDEDGQRGEIIAAGAHVYDVLDHGTPTWLAAAEGGLFALSGGVLRSERGLAEAYAIAPGPGGPWVAAGAGGVSGADVTLDTADTWSVASVGGRLWIGTDHGLFWRAPEGGVEAVARAAWPAEGAVHDLVVCKAGVTARLAAGVVNLGVGCPPAAEPPAIPSAVAATLPGPVEAVTRDGETLWVVARSALFEVSDRDVRPHFQTRVPIAVASGGGHVCIGTAFGVETVDGQRVDLGDAVPAVAVDGAGCWYATAGGLVGRTAGDSVALPASSEPAVHRLVVDPVDPDAVWVLSDRGAWRVRLP